jgi:imidazolonepropionase-like amidohydrolase
MSDPLLIRNARIVDVSNGAIEAGRSVLVRRDRIEAIGRFPGWSGASLDAAGSYLCPGLIDCHVHFFLDAGPDPRGSYISSDDSGRMATARKNARLAIQAGITTMRDCAAPGHLMVRFQRQVDAGDVPGPHIISCGYALMRPKGHCYFLGGEVATVRDLRERIEWNLSHGAGFVKLMASGGGLTPGTIPHEADLPVEIMKAAVREAHANGVRITAHCHATDSIRRGIEVGLDMIEHASFVESPGRYRYDEELTRQIRDAGIIVSPTVYSALQTARRFRAAGAAHNPGDVAAVERLEGRLINTGHFRRLGMKIIGGTDCGATNTPFDSLVDELDSYTEAGLTRTEALRSVTDMGAYYLGLSQIGQVRPGHRADLTLLEGNPLEDLEVLRQPLKVYKSGRLVHERNGGDAV